jgi:hypothetical protein
VWYNCPVSAFHNLHVLSYKSKSKNEKRTILKSNTEKIHTKRSSDDLITIWIIEGYGVDNVPVSLQCEKLISSYCIPYFACSIITTSNKFIPRLIESAIG